MASLRDIKRRIDSVKSTQKITRAMKMVAASKLRRAQEGIIAARPYAGELAKLMHNLVVRAEERAHPLLRRSSEGKVVVAIFTADRGLCGGFNGGLVSKAEELLRTDLADRDVEFIVIGRKGIDLFKRRSHPVRATHTGMLDGDVMQNAVGLVDDVVEQFVAGEIGTFYCLYNRFQSALVQHATLEQLLPIQAPEVADGEESSAPTTDYVYEPSPSAVLQQILIHHLYTQVHRILFDSSASEQGARMTAMESATNNAGDMIDRLTLVYNRARQSAITTEMIEIISGAEAL